MSETKTSKVIGVSWDKSRNRWTARKSVDGNRLLIGRFQTEAEAIEALKSFIKFNNEEFSDGIHVETEYEETPVLRDWRGWSDNFFTRLYKKLRNGNV